MMHLASGPVFVQAQIVNSIYVKVIDIESLYTCTYWTVIQMWIWSKKGGTKRCTIIYIIAHVYIIIMIIYTFGLYKRVNSYAVDGICVHVIPHKFIQNFLQIAHTNTHKFSYSIYIYES